MRFVALLLHRPLSLIVAVLVAAGTASGGPIISTPSGLNAGDQFRIVFVTSGTTTAESRDITTYDNFVNDQASGATYNGNTITWQAIGSTSGVNAIDHIGVTNAPVYLADGTLVAGTDGSWFSDSSPVVLSHAINEDITTAKMSVVVWTGTRTSGTPPYQGALGQTSSVAGYSYLTDGQWVDSISTDPTQYFHLYGISDVLTVQSAAVPEPSTAMLAGLGSLAAVAISAYPRRRVAV